jgi:hypothetical protein
VSSSREQSLFHGTDRTTYAVEAEVSAPTATNDLRGLMDAGLIRQQGRGPAKQYVASERLADEFVDNSGNEHHRVRQVSGRPADGNQSARTKPGRSPRPGDRHRAALLRGLVDAEMATAHDGTACGSTEVRDQTSVHDGIRSAWTAAKVRHGRGIAVAIPLQTALRQRATRRRERSGPGG